ncbi:MAG: hypothetical protein RL367_2120 [Pseudomonadota bacterium]
MIRTLAETGSTNADLIALARSGTEDGLWLRAERQSAGRGRMGRGWESPVGNLYASHLVRLRAGDPEAPSLAFVAAVAVDEALRCFAGDVEFQIKWPNDVMAFLSPAPPLKGRGFKIAGILLERADDAVVIGIGVNLSHHPENLDRPVTSLTALGVPAPDPATFLEAMAEIFAAHLATWRSHGTAPIRTRWIERAHPAGTALSVSQPDGTKLEGLFVGLDTDCALMLRLADGSIRAIHAGDVFLI